MAKSFGKNILGLFVQFDDEGEKPKPALSPAPEKSNPPSRSIPVSSIAQTGKQDDTVAQVLADTLEKANLEGYDYFEFAKTIDQLKSSQPSEQTLFTTAFTLGNVMGASKGKIIQTANVYLDVLKKKADEFESVFQSKLNESVTAKESDLKKIDSDIQQKAVQIQKLTEEINGMTSEKSKIANDISENRIKIETTRNNFNTTLQIFTARIQGDLEKIGRYIP